MGVEKKGASSDAHICASLPISNYTKEQQQLIPCYLKYIIIIFYK